MDEMYKNMVQELLSDPRVPTDDKLILVSTGILAEIQNYVEDQISHTESSQVLEVLMKVKTLLDEGNSVYVGFADERYS